MLEQIENKFKRIPLFNFLNQREQREVVARERTDVFMNFMRSAGVNVDQLSPEIVAKWCSNMRDLNATEKFLHLSCALHAAYIWSDTEVNFSLTEKPLVVYVAQNVATAPRIVQELHIFFSGVIPDISEIKSVASKGKSPYISFRNNAGLGFDLVPELGGIVFNFIGDQPRT